MKLPLQLMTTCSQLGLNPNIKPTSLVFTSWGKVGRVTWYPSHIITATTNIHTWSRQKVGQGPFLDLPISNKWRSMSFQNLCQPSRRICCSFKWICCYLRHCWSQFRVSSQSKTKVYSSETIHHEKSCSEEISVSLVTSFTISEDMERHSYIAILR